MCTSITMPWGFFLVTSRTLQNVCVWGRKEGYISLNFEHIDKDHVTYYMPHPVHETIVWKIQNPSLISTWEQSPYLVYIFTTAQQGTTVALNKHNFSILRVEVMSFTHWSSRNNIGQDYVVSPHFNLTVQHHPLSHTNACNTMTSKNQFFKLNTYLLICWPDWRSLNKPNVSILRVEAISFTHWSSRNNIGQDYVVSPRFSLTIQHPFSHTMHAIPWHHKISS
jgi:hypothetical protein